MFCRPPTSPLCSSGTAETVTAPSCEASAPDPEAGEEHRPGDDLGGAGVESSRATSTHDADEQRARNPMRHDPARRGVGKQLRDADRGEEQSVIDSGRIRTPVSIADRPSATERNSGTAKNRPACSRNWKKNDVSPPRSSRIPQHRRVDAAAPCRRRDGAFSQREEQPAARAPPPSIEPDHRREAEPRGPPGFGLDEAPGAGAQDAEDDQAEAERPRARCRRGRAAAPVLGGASSTMRAKSEDARRR